MGLSKSKERILCEDYVKLNNMKKNKLPLQTLARKISKENGSLMTKLNTTEKVRKHYLLGIVGKSGSYNRKKSKDKSLFEPITNNTSNYKSFKEEVNTEAKILILDIETAPINAFVWDVWQQNVSGNQIISDWFCLTWAAKWLFDKKVYSDRLTEKEAKKQDDKRIIKSIWALVNEADIVIAHNGEKFDLPRLNTRFLIHRLNPPLPYQQIDTLKHIRRNFAFSHNKLDEVNRILQLPRKMEHEGMPLWVKCFKGEEQSLKKMLAYNIDDVKILEETYLRIRSWIKPHPNVGLHILDEGQSRCPTCGHNDMQNQDKDYHTTANVFELLRCGNCNSVSRKRLSKIKVDQRRHLLLAVPK
jgi:DNA polymerase III epsilon subunit-like protein